MKWISTLTNDDLESMKQLVKFVEEEPNLSHRSKVKFQNNEYEVKYLKSVISVLETNIIPDHLMDLDIEDIYNNNN